jgi:hypothetical protein
MKKQHKMLIGVGLVAIVSYLIIKNNRKKSFTANTWFSDPEIIGRPINIINR